MLWTCCLLGGLRLESAERCIERFRTEKTALLLGYLAYFAGTWFERVALAEMFWGEGRDPDASFRTAICSLRKQLEPLGIPAGSVLQTVGKRIRLNPDAVETDVRQFHSLLQRARHSRDLDERLTALVDALALYQGELLHGYEAEWLTAPRVQLEQAYLSALQEAVPLLLQVGEHETARRLAEQASRIYPLNEAVAQLLIRLYFSLNEPASAEAAYRRYQHELGRVLGEYPRFTLETLRGERLPVGKARSLLPAPSAPLPKRLRASVPAPLTRFFGRESELQQVTHWLQRGARLITITGLPGVGKTRLGQELGLRLEAAYGGRVFWVSLREVRSEAEVRRAFAHAFECDTEKNGDALLDALAARLGDAPALLITDNWEQVLDAAPFLAQLLQRLPRLQAIALSRHPLELEGEVWLILEPLPLPDSDAPLEQLLQNPAVALFVDRAQATRPDFTLMPANAPQVAQLCRLMESVPLALELSAAQLSRCSLSQLLHTAHERLDWLSSRRRALSYTHRSLQAALESSYILLPPSLQDAFVRLAILQGEWDEALADALLGEPAAPYLEQLIHHSLLQRSWQDETPLYSMLESVRLFARRKLGKNDEVLRQRLFEFFEQLGKIVRVEFNTAAQLKWLFYLRQRYPNVETAIEWGVSNAPRRAATLLVDYGYFLDWEQRWEEARRWCVRLLNSPTLTQRQRAQLLSWLGLFLLRLEQPAQAETHLLESIQLCRKWRDWDELAGAYNMLGLVKMSQLCYEEAAQAFERGVAAARRSARPVILAPVLLNWGWLNHRQKRYQDALQLVSEARTLYEQIHAPLPLANTLNLMGICYAALQRYDAAQACYEQAAAHYQTAGYQQGVARVFNNLADMALEQGQLAQAADYLEQAQALCHQGSCPLLLQGIVLLNRARWARLHGQAAEAQRLVHQCRALAANFPELMKAIAEWENSAESSS
ncbi:MAG: tetratricopeptide repeat protein [Fimbriimonadales bacterium]